jgi:hypothetical protein
VARWFDPVTAHFVQADTEAPQLGQPQTFDRYMYANQNPIRYNDPTGHDAGMGCLPYYDRYTYSGYNYNYDFYSELRDSVSYFQSPIHSTPITMAAQFNVSISSNNAAANYVQPAAPSVQISHTLWSVAAQWASNATSIVPVIAKGLPEGAKFSPILSSAGAIFSGISQYEKDSNYPYTIGQHLTRAAIVGGEGLAISGFGNYVGGVTGIASAGIFTVSAPETFPEGPGLAAIVGYGAGYLTFVNDVSIKANDWNESYFFKLAHASLDPSRQCPFIPPHK